MAYTKTNWQDLPDTSTPITAARLNNMEDGIKTNDDKLLGNIAAGTLIADITGNAATATSLENRSFITQNSSTYLQGNDGDIETKKALVNWNGAYDSSNNSNLEYCKNGEIASLTKYDIYSTTENTIGIWIDNKVIYRKTYQLTGDNTNSQTLATLSGVDNIVNIQCYASSGGYFRNCTTVYYGSDAWSSQVYYYNGDIVLECGNNFKSFKNGATIYLTVEYTKSV